MQITIYFVSKPLLVYPPNDYSFDSEALLLSTAVLYCFYFTRSRGEDSLEGWGARRMKQGRG